MARSAPESLASVGSPKILLFRIQEFLGSDFYWANGGSPRARPGLQGAERFGAHGFFTKEGMLHLCRGGCDLSMQLIRPLLTRACRLTGLRPPPAPFPASPPVQPTHRHRHPR